MEETFDLELKRTAKSEGGDRYETTIKGEKKPWVVYVPQSISRKGNKPARDHLAMTIAD